MAALLNYRVIALVCSLALLALVATAYRSAPENAFHFDDSHNIVDVPAVHMDEFSLEGLGYAAQNAALKNRPLPSMTFAIDWWRGGGKPGPFIWTNMVIHALAVLASFALLTLIFRHAGYAPVPCLFAAAIGSALWATHPIQAQVVTFVVQRMASMAALFVMLSMIGYLQARTSDRHRVAWWVFCFVALMAGAISKENAWIAPVILLIVEFGVVRHGKSFFGNKKVDLFFLFMPIIVGVLILVDMTTGIGPFPDFLGAYEHRDFTLWERLLTQPRVIAFHLSQIVWPSPDRFSIAHDFITSTSILTPPTTLLAIVAVILWCGAGVYALARPRFRMLGFFLLFFPVALITESSIIPLEMIFEHRMYLPSFALAGLSGFACLAYLENAKPQRYAVSAAATAVVVFLLVSATDTTVAKWKDNYTLWSHALKHAPMDPRVHDNLSFAFQERNELDEALVHARRTVQLDPMFLTGLHNLGRLLQQKGDRIEAYEMYTRALKLKPEYGPAHFSLGMMYLEAGDNARANLEFARALEYDPNHSEAKRFYAYTEKAKDKGAAPAHP